MTDPSASGAVRAVVSHRPTLCNGAGHARGLSGVRAGVLEPPRGHRGRLPLPHRVPLRRTVGVGAQNSGSWESPHELFERPCVGEVPQGIGPWCIGLGHQVWCIGLGHQVLESSGECRNQLGNHGPPGQTPQGFNGTMKSTNKKVCKVSPT